MAIRIHSYFKGYRQRVLVGAAVIQIGGALIASGIAWLLWQNFTFDPLLIFLLSAIALIAVNIGLAIILVNIATKPFGVVAQAIAHVSKDPVITPPPALTSAYERSGLKELIQTVYELAVAATPNIKKEQAGPAPASDFLRGVIDRAPCGIVVFSADGQMTYSNTAAPVSPTPGGDKTLDLEFAQGDDLITWVNNVRTNKVRDTHLWLRVADKVPGEMNRRIYDVIGSYQKDDPSGVEVVLITFDRTQVYSENQEDMDFIALAAHELRSPITVIRGYLDVFYQEIAPGLSAEQHQLLDRLQVSAERLSGYVNNILNVSRYDRHQLPIHLQEANLGDIINTLAPEMQLRATTQNRSVTFNVAKDLPTVAADRTSIAEVFTNLIDNAIKYSSQGGEIVVAAAPKENFVEITVTDKGIGMPGNVVSNLFSRFYRSHKSRQAVAGTGLGLYICKAIVESHGGSIWVRSVEGQGSTFGFTLQNYASVADKLKNGDTINQGVTRRPEGWIKNHAMYRG